MDLTLMLFANLIIALVGAILCAAIYASVAKFMKITEIHFLEFLGTMALSSLIGMAIGIAIAFLMQMKNQGFPTVESIWGKIVAQYAITLVAIVVFNKQKIKTSKNLTAVILPPAVLFAILLYAISYPALTVAHEIEKRMVCISHLSGIGKALLLYQADHQDQLPSSLEDLRGMEDMNEIVDKILRCPSAVSKGISVPHYEYHPSGKLFGDHDDKVPIAWDKANNHKNGRNVLFRDGVVRWFSEDEFNKLQPEPQKTLRAPQ